MWLHAEQWKHLGISSKFIANEWKRFFLFAQFIIRCYFYSKRISNENFAETESNVSTCPLWRNNFVMVLQCFATYRNLQRNVSEYKNDKRKMFSGSECFSTETVCKRYWNAEGKRLFPSDRKWKFHLAKVQRLLQRIIWRWSLMKTRSCFTCKCDDHSRESTSTCTLVLFCRESTSSCTLVLFCWNVQSCFPLTHTVFACHIKAVKKGVFLIKSYSRVVG
jgi:hypothetical protein